MPRREHPHDDAEDANWTKTSVIETPCQQAVLQQFERRLAVADSQCPFNNFGAWERTMEDVYARYEQKFVEQHSTEILAYLAAQDA